MAKKPDPRISEAKARIAVLQEEINELQKATKFFELCPHTQELLNTLKDAKVKLRLDFYETRGGALEVYSVCEICQSDQDVIDYFDIERR